MSENSRYILLRGKAGWNQMRGKQELFFERYFILLRIFLFYSQYNYMPSEKWLLILLSSFYSGFLLNKIYLVFPLNFFFFSSDFVSTNIIDIFLLSVSYMSGLNWHKTYKISSVSSEVIYWSVVFVWLT